MDDPRYSFSDAFLSRSAVPELASLLDPISTDNPTGSDLRNDIAPNAIYQRLRESRTNARNNERAALANGDNNFINRSDWTPVVDLATQLLSSTSKDLEITAWLIEALTRTQGFSGAASGFLLAHQLIERYGPDLHPTPDEEGVATQLAALSGLNGFGSEGALIAPLKSVPLTEGAPPAPFSAWQCEQAFETERIGDHAKRAARGKRGFALRSDIDQAVAETSPAVVTALNDEIQAAVTAFSTYQETLDRYCADSPQPTARLKETLLSIEQTFRHIAGDKIVERHATPTLEAALQAEPDVVPATAEAILSRQSLADRSAALAQLREVALFFRRTEPHSPISYAVEQAVYWSELSLPELIGELIPDEGAREKFRTLTGIRTGEK